MKQLLFVDLANVEISNSVSEEDLGCEKGRPVVTLLEEKREELSFKAPPLGITVGGFPKIRSVSEAILERNHMDSCRTDESSSRRSNPAGLSDGDEDSALTSYAPQHLSEEHKEIQGPSQPYIGTGGPLRKGSMGVQHVVKDEDSWQGATSQQTLGSPRPFTTSSSSQSSPNVPTCNNIASVFQTAQEHLPDNHVSAWRHEERGKDEDSLQDLKMQNPEGTGTIAKSPSTSTSPNTPKHTPNTKDNASSLQSPQKSVPAIALATAVKEEPLDTQDSSKDLKTSEIQDISPPIHIGTGTITKEENNDPPFSSTSPYPISSGTSPTVGIEGSALHSSPETSTRNASTAQSSRASSKSSNQDSPSGKSVSHKVPPQTFKVIPWTMGEHRDFVSAIFSLGLTHCSPSLIMEEMKQIPKDISRENIKSHLQKFRKTTDRSVADFMEEFDSFLHRIETEKARKAKDASQPNSSSPQASKVGTNVSDPLKTIMAGSDPEELLGGAAAAYAAYAVKHGYAPRNDRNKILYEATPADLPRLSTAEQESSLGRSLKQVKGALDFVRDLILKKRHGIPFKIDKRIPPFLKKEDVDEHLPTFSRYNSDLSDKVAGNNTYSAPLPTHVSMSAQVPPTYGPPHNYHPHHQVPVGGGYPYHFAYPTGDGSHGAFSGSGTEHLYAGGYASYHEFHHPVMYNQPLSSSGYHLGSLPFNPYQVGPYVDPARPAASDYYQPPMHPSGDPYRGNADSSKYSTMGSAPHYHGAPEAFFEPPHNSSSYYQQDEARTDNVRSTKSRKGPEEYSRMSVPFYPSESGTKERRIRQDIFDNDPILRTDRPESRLSVEPLRAKRSWSPIISPTLNETAVDNKTNKRSKLDLSVDTSAACVADRPLSFELSDLGLHADPDPDERRKATSIVSGNQSSPFSVTSVLRSSMMRSSPSTTPDRVIRDFGRTVPTPSDDDRRYEVPSSPQPRINR